MNNVLFTNAISWSYGRSLTNIRNCWSIRYLQVDEKMKFLILQDTRPICGICDKPIHGIVWQVEIKSYESFKVHQKCIKRIIKQAIYKTGRNK